MGYRDDHEHMPSEERLRELLVGKVIDSVSLTHEGTDGDVGPTGRIVMADGTVLRVWGNDGGCACDAGCYPLTALNAPGGVVTNVEVDEKPDYEDRCEQCTAEGKERWSDCDHRGWYRIFVVTADERTLLASFDGSDGNGYYGTGWWLKVAA